jgi:hypothetical protein
MKRIDTSFVIDPSIQQPFTVKSLDFLQDSMEEVAGVIARKLVKDRGYSSNAPFKILQVDSQKWWVYVGGKLWLYDATTTPMGANIATISNPSNAADPLQFSDGINRNVHNERVLVPTVGTLGFGIFDLADLIDLSDSLFTLPISVSSFGTGWSALNAVSYNKTQNQPTGGRVYLAGAVQKATNTTQVVFTLQTDYRPTSETYITAPIDLDGIRSIGLLQIQTDGDIIVDIGGSATLCKVYLDGVNFQI